MHSIDLKVSRVIMALGRFNIRQTIDKAPLRCNMVSWTNCDNMTSAWQEHLQTLNDLVRRTGEFHGMAPIHAQDTIDDLMLDLDWQCDGGQQLLLGFEIL